MNLRPFVLALSTWSVPSPNGFSEAMRLGAFRALEDLGLVQIEQNCGAFVRKIDLDEAVEIHDVYSALEELPASSAARRLSGTQIAELKSLVKSMDAAADGVCQTDAHVRDQACAVPLPVVLGHEGAGVVEKVGSAVTTVVSGDHVALLINPAASARQTMTSKTGENGAL